MINSLSKAKELFLTGNCHDLAQQITECYDKYKWQQSEFAKSMAGAECLKTQRKKVKTVGFFYHRLYEGGAERVISHQILMFLNMGYKVVLFTEEIKKDREYAIPEDVKRIKLPRKYESKRAEHFIRELKQNDVDILLYHAASSPILAFDVVLARLCNVPVVVTRHELTTQDFVFAGTHIASYPHVYRLCNKLVVLSKMEETFYRNVGVNAVYVPNPIENKPVALNNSQREDAVLWIGRLDQNQKRYRDALEIMKRVIELRPETKCYIVGGVQTPGADLEINRFIKKFKLQNSIKWYDHTLDVASFYRRSKVHLVTSRFESFPMMIIESKTYGLPMVNYDMPYLELLRDQKGYVSVPQHDISAAAHAVVDILNHPETWERLSVGALESIEPFRQHDLSLTWDGILKSIEQSCDRGKSEEFKLNLLFWDTMMGFLEEGIGMIRSDMGHNSDNADKSETADDSVKADVSEKADISEKCNTPVTVKVGKSRKLHRRIGRWLKRQREKARRLLK